MAKPQKLSETSITVLRLIADGKSYAQIVDGQMDISYKDIFTASEEALNLLDSVPNYHERQATIKKQFPRAYELWETDEDDELANLHDMGKPVSEISAHFGRQPSAIRSRLAKLGFKTTELRP